MPTSINGTTGIDQVQDGSIGTADLANGAVSFAKLLGTDWAASLSANGYQKLPSGLIIQWGSSASVAAVTFPITYTTALFSVVVQYNSSLGDSINPLGISARSVSGFTPQSFDASGSSIYWIAIGY